MSHMTTIVLTLDPETAWIPQTADEVFERIGKDVDGVQNHPSENEAIENFMDYVEDHFGKRVDSRCFEVDLCEYRKFIYRDFRNPRFNDCKTIEEAFMLERKIMTGFGDHLIVFPEGYYSDYYRSYMAFLFDTFILDNTELDTVKVFIHSAYDTLC